LANKTVRDDLESSIELVRLGRNGARTATGGVLTIAMCLVAAVGCAGKERPFGEASPGSDNTELSMDSEGGRTDAPPLTPAMDTLDDVPGPATDRERPAAIADVLPGDAIAGQASEPCDSDGGSCMSVDDSENSSACIPTGPRDCTSALDNDCDGEPDNTLNDTCVCSAESVEPCEEHPGLDGRGQCRAGTRTCVLGEGNLTTSWAACEGSVGPGEQDSCSIAGDDTDCDGVNNGGCPCVEGEMRPCGPDTENGICQRGTQTCVNRTYGQCVGAVFSASRNCSSNQDNDCDGRPDNTVDNVCTCLVGSSQACGTHPGRDGNGQCQAGSQRCEARSNNTTSTFGNCTGSVGPALQDTCASGNDGNCNGVLNEGCACVNGQTRACGPDTDVGLCQRGTQTCVNGFFGSCQGAVFPAPRNCASAQDNDCDGRPDNTLDNVCECSPGSRRCAPASGVPQLCSNAGRWQDQQGCARGCQDGVCIPQLGLGAACGSARDCSSGFCTDGVCCESQCGGVCAQCEAGSGACVTPPTDTACSPVICASNDCQISSGNLTSNLCRGRGQCKNQSDCNFSRFERGTPCDTANSDFTICDGAGTCIEPTVTCNGASGAVGEDDVCCDRRTGARVPFTITETFSTSAECRGSALVNAGATPIRCDDDDDCRTGSVCCLTAAQGDSRIGCIAAAACNNIPTQFVTFSEVCGTSSGLSDSCPTGFSCTGGNGSLATGWANCR
jgi:hypothetical protein